MLLRMLRYLEAYCQGSGFRVRALGFGGGCIVSGMLGLGAVLSLYSLDLRTKP